MLRALRRGDDHACDVSAGTTTGSVLGVVGSLTLSSCCICTTVGSIVVVVVPAVAAAAVVLLNLEVIRPIANIGHEHRQ